MSPGGSSGSSASSASYSSGVIGSSLMKPQVIASSIRRRRADPNAAAAARQRVGSCIDAFGGAGTTRPRYFRNQGKRQGYTRPPPGGRRAHCTMNVQTCALTLDQSYVLHEVIEGQASIGS